MRTNMFRVLALATAVPCAIAQTDLPVTKIVEVGDVVPGPSGTQMLLPQNVQWWPEWQTPSTDGTAVTFAVPVDDGSPGGSEGLYRYRPSLGLDVVVDPFGSTSLEGGAALPAETLWHHRPQDDFVYFSMGDASLVSYMTSPQGIRALAFAGMPIGPADTPLGGIGQGKWTGAAFIATARHPPAQPNFTDLIAVDATGRATSLMTELLDDFDDGLMVWPGVWAGPRADMHGDNVAAVTMVGVLAVRWDGNWNFVQYDGFNFANAVAINDARVAYYTKTEGPLFPGRLGWWTPLEGHRVIEAGDALPNGDVLVDVPLRNRFAMDGDIVVMQATTDRGTCVYRIDLEQMTASPLIELGVDRIAGRTVTSVGFGEASIAGGTLVFAATLDDATGGIFTIDIEAVSTPCVADLTTDGTANGTPDGAVTLSDFSFYLMLWSARDAAADVTTDGTANGIPDGSVTLSDFSMYLSLWSAGCP
mgnify:CR=1 FL=1